MLFALLVPLAVVVAATALPTKPKQVPLVVWHGLGDSWGSPAMERFMDEVRESRGEDLFIHSVHIAEDLEQDQKAGWFGNVREQLELVHAQLSTVPQLADGFDALGFSQGGQFLRAYIQIYGPRVRNLITFGSQHFGVSDLPNCKPRDPWCSLARAGTRAGVYTTWAQHNLIQAQYFRDADRLDQYLRQSTFLAVVNNEVEDSRNATYAENLKKLHNFVAILFTQEKTVVPKESSWFGSYAPRNGSDNQERTVIPMRLQPLYVEDWIGIRALDETGRLDLRTCDGEHMQLSEECLDTILKKYVGGFWEANVRQDAKPLLIQLPASGV